MSTVATEICPDIDSTLSSMMGAADVGRVLTSRSGTLLHHTERLKPIDPHTTGWYQGMTVRKGFSLIMMDTHYSARSDLEYVSADHLKLHFKLDGESLISGERQESRVAAGLSFLVQPPNTVKQEAIKENSRHRAVTLVCSRDFAAGLLQASNGNLPAALVEYLKGPTAHFTHGHAPLPPQLRAVVEDMLAIQQGPLSELMLEARALELLYLCVQQLSAGPVGLKPRSRRKVDELCELLSSEEGSTMNIAQLCRMLAWNETQMMESFKQVMGTTISSYRQRLKMEYALRELRSTDRSITDIAFEAGYEHPGNFATAFKRTFGFSPKAGRSRPN